MDFILNNGNFKMFYNTITNKKKERFELILEPLQAILQIAFLSFSPKGTKITINKNILQLQLPYYTQGIMRWYQNDNKDDLFYLFYVCKRFSRFYHHLKIIKNGDYNLYDVLIYCAIDGLNNLIQTYSNSEKMSLLHTLELYKLLLRNPQQFDAIDNNNNDDIFDQNKRCINNTHEHNNKRYRNKSIESNVSDNSHKSNVSDNSYSSTITAKTNYESGDNIPRIFSGNSEASQSYDSLQEFQKNIKSLGIQPKNKDIEKGKNKTPLISNTKIEDKNTRKTISRDKLDKTSELNINRDIESVFIKIINLYEDYELNIILNSLLLLLNNKNMDSKNQEKIIRGLNDILYPTTSQINKWIHKNIVF